MKSKKPEVTTVQRELPCQLSDDQIIERANAMADLDAEISKLKDRRKSVNQKIREKDDERLKLSDEVEKGTELRMVTCRVDEDFAHNVVRIVRNDTGETVEERPMTAADRQESMGLVMGERYGDDDDGGGDEDTEQEGAPAPA